jgi:hypothetical protein
MLALPLAAAAHTGVPDRTERVKAGPYTLELRYYGTPHAGQPLGLMIVPVAGGQPTAIRVAADPGAGVSATAARVSTSPDSADATATDALIYLSTAGLWVITVSADGPAGTGQAETGIVAAAPGAIPVPVGWAIALTPLIGIVGFALSQRRWLKRMQSAEWGVRNDESSEASASP